MISRDPIKEALLRLPIQEDRRYKVEFYTHGLAVCGEYFKQLDLPSELDAGSTAAVASIRNFEKLAYNLSSHIAAMPRDALATISSATSEDLECRAARSEGLRQKMRESVGDFADVALIKNTPMQPLELAREIDNLLRLTDAARRKLAESPTPNRIGARPKNRAAAVTRLAATAYEDLTGRDVAWGTKEEKVNRNTKGQKAYGLFLEFLAELFGVMGINASAEGQAKKLRLEKSDPK